MSEPKNIITESWLYLMSEPKNIITKSWLYLESKKECCPCDHIDYVNISIYIEGGEIIQEKKVPTENMSKEYVNFFNFKILFQAQEAILNLKLTCIEKIHISIVYNNGLKIKSKKFDQLKLSK